MSFVFKTSVLHQVVSEIESFETEKGGLVSEINVIGRILQENVVPTELKSLLEDLVLFIREVKVSDFKSYEALSKLGRVGDRVFQVQDFFEENPSERLDICVTVANRLFRRYFNIQRIIIDNLIDQGIWEHEGP